MIAAMPWGDTVMAAAGVYLGIVAAAHGVGGLRVVCCVDVDHRAAPAQVGKRLLEGDIAQEWRCAITSNGHPAVWICDLRTHVMLKMPTTVWRPLSPTLQIWVAFGT